MAGIGFNLKKLLDQRTLQSKVSAYFYAAIVTSGPWLFSVISLSLISYFARGLVDPETINKFLGIVVYAFGSSMVFTGGSQLVVTRVVSDYLYEKQEEKILGIFVAAILLTIGVSVLVVVPLLWFFEVPFQLAIQMFMMFFLSALMWFAMVFVSALKAYMRVVWAFLIGFMTTIPLTLWLGFYWKLGGLIFGMNLGISLIVFLLFGSSLLEFKGSLKPDFYVFWSHKKYWLLWLTGIFLNLGVWGDKIVLWLHVGEPIIGTLRVYPSYDSAMFFAYLSVIPSMAFFVMVIETEFFHEYRRYYYLVENKVPFLSLEYARRNIISVLMRGGAQAVGAQMIITTGAILFSSWIVTLLGMQWDLWHIFRIGCLGAFLHMSTSLLIIILSYFDCQIELFFVSAIYCIVLVLGTYFLRDYFWLYGYGYVIAGLCTTLISLGLILNRVKNLHYYTLLHPPILRK
ncbi:MAG: putative membrane protein [bacterium]|jgi:uncharacterized membrane protein